MKRILYILLTITLLQSCNESKTPDPTQTVYKNYIKAFIVEPQFEAGYREGTDNLSESFGISSSYGNAISSGPTFTQLCEKYGDNHYDRHEAILNQHNCVYADVFTSIDITCDIDFDNDHPAGTSLADVAMIHASSPYKFIQSGYDGKFGWTEIPEFQGTVFGVSPGFRPIYKLLSQIVPEDLILLNFSIRFTFTKPRPEGEQTYTITFKTKDKTLQTSITIK